MRDTDKVRALLAVMEDAGLDALVVGGAFNVRYVSAAWVPMTHAQPDRPMLALMQRSGARALIVPAVWRDIALECADVDEVHVVPAQEEPLAAACRVAAASLAPASVVGIDGAAMTVAVGSALAAELTRAGHVVVECGKALGRARMIKTPTEREVLRELALKTDHAINGYFHHLIANRASSALVMSEQLRIHSLERDIELSGYNACARAKVGEGTKTYWPYAPNYDFAAMDVRKYPNDLIVAEVSNTDGGYWSNSVRMAVNAKTMPGPVERACEDINRLRRHALDCIRPGRTCARIYEDLSRFAAREGIPVDEAVPFGFSVGVAPMEAPFFSPGDPTPVEAGMVFVLDLVVVYDGVLYRSRDNVEVTQDGAQIVAWYKDWREPYLAIGHLADFAM